MNIKASNVLAAKTARACDSCLIKRARWFCAADDAFLCQTCDAAIHSANLLASRHRKVRLDAPSCKASQPPAWHHGFTKKPRTPRHANATLRPPSYQLPIVPEIGSDDPFLEENDEQLFCRVPVFDDEFCTGGSVADMVFDDDQGGLNLKELLDGCEAELAEFAADVESLLGADTATGIDDGLILIDEKRVKEEDNEDEAGGVIACHLEPALNEELRWDFDCSRINAELGEEIMKREDHVGKTIEMENGRKRTLLRLNYETVIAAWASRGSPWTDGIRPHFNRLDEFMGAWLRVDGGGRREAWVWRYREKRRTRLFSRKIRYEVRKLNADNRPRLKGRFVKTTPYLASTLPLPTHQ